MRRRAEGGAGQVVEEGAGRARLSGLSRLIRLLLLSRYFISHCLVKLRKLLGFVVLQLDLHDLIDKHDLNMPNILVLIRWVWLD